jgi:hypothetical protein
VLLGVTQRFDFTFQHRFQTLEHSFDTPATTGINRRFGQR